MRAPKKQTTLWCGSCVSLALLLPGANALSAQGISSGSDTQAQIVREIDRAEQYREENLAGYMVIEHYIIRNSHFNEPGDVVVHTEYERGAGKTYQVLSRNGPSILRNRVMDRVLQEEAIMSRGKARIQSLIVSANYDFRLLGEEKIGDTMCWALELAPKMKSPHLLRGHGWVDLASKALVRVDGQPPVSISFFAGRTNVVRDYKVIDGFALAQRSYAISEGLIQGKTEIDITYENYIVRRNAPK